VPVFGSGTGSRGDNLVSNAVAPHRLQQRPSIVTPGNPVLTDAYVLEPGTAGNNVSTPHQAGFDPAGDLVVVTYIAPDDWTPAATQCVASDYTTAANGAWRLTLNTAGTLSFQNSVGGVADVANCTIAPPGVGDGFGVWLYWYRQSSDGTTDFKYSYDLPTADPATIVWTNIQINRAAQLGVLTAPTADVHIGGFAAGATDPFAGKIYRVIAYTSTAMSTKLWDMRPGDWTSGTTWVSAATGETWTINGTASVVPAAGGGSPQTVTAQIATGTWTAIAGTVTAGPVTVTAQVAAGTWTAIAGTVTAGAVTKTAQVATGTWTANPGTVTAGNATVTAQVAAGTWTAIPGTLSAGGGGPQSVTAQIATGTWSAVVGTPTGGAVSLTAQVATATWTAIPGTVTGGPVTKTAQIATGTWTAIPGTVTGGPVTVAAQVATGTWSAVAGTISSGGQIVTAQIAVATWTANPGTVTGGPTTITAQVATAAWSAVAGALVSAGVLVELGDAITGYNPGRIYGANPAPAAGANPGRIDGTNPAATVGRNPGMTFGQNPAAVAGRNSPQLVGSLR